ncbi:MAG: hypothetical protein KBE09_04420 [Candidatus Pacebacteria bacterium]|nr:hypothetical protein [Candidatus Paceibacterota bacterium]
MALTDPPRKATFRLSDNVLIMALLVAAAALGFGCLAVFLMQSYIDGVIAVRLPHGLR